MTHINIKKIGNKLFYKIINNFIKYELYIIIYDYIKIFFFLFFICFYLLSFSSSSSSSSSSLFSSKLYNNSILLIGVKSLI